MIQSKVKHRALKWLETLFFPAFWLVSRLRFRVKAGLLLLILIIAFFLVIASLYQRLNRDIETARQELIGLDLLPPLYRIVERMQEHRGLSSGVLSGGTVLDKVRQVKQQMVTRAFKSLGDKLPAEIISSTDWQEIREGWLWIVAHGLTLDVADNFSRQQQLIEKLLRFSTALADRFSLTSQPDIGIHYLLKALLDQLPAKLESLARLRGVVTGILAQQHASVAQVVQVKILLYQARSAMTSLRQDLEHTGQLNPSIQYQLTTAAQRLSTQYRSVVTPLRLNLLAVNLPVANLPVKMLYMSAADFFARASTAISTGYSITSRDLIPEIRRLILQRLNEAKNTRISSLLVAITALLLVLYFSIGMYWSALRSIQYISRTADQLARGDLGLRLQMGAKSELGAVADSINDLVDELTRLVRLEKESRERVQAIVDSSQDALVELDAEGRITGWSYQAQKQLGWTRDQVLGQDSRQVLIPESLRDRHLLRIDEFISTGDAAQLNKGIETKILHRDGHSIAVEVSLAPVRTAQGYEFNVFIRDISLRKQSQLRKQTRRLVLEQLVNSEPLSDILASIIKAVEQENPLVLCSILLLDRDGNNLLLGAAPSLPDFFNAANDGFAVGEDVGCSDVLAYRGQRILVEDLQKNTTGSAARELAFRAQLHSCWSEPVIGADARVLGAFTLFRRQPGQPGTADIALIEYAAQLTALAIERHRANQRLQLSSRIFTEAGEGITVTDAKGTILDVNPAFCAITGYSRSEVLGKNPSILKSGKQSGAFYASMWQQIREQGSWQGEIWNRRKNGELYAEILTISSIMNEEHEISHYVGLFSDITLIKQQQKTLEFMAHYDVLTALPNRNLFADRLNQAISRSKRKQTLLAVCFLDLDNFKAVNDQYGHATGDRLLIEVTSRIRANIREEDTACRQGGDEFVLLLQELKTMDQCEQMLERICNAVAQPYPIDGCQHRISVSTGVTLYPMDDADPDMLVRHADQAMYQAKQAGKNRYHLFDVAKDQQSVNQHQRLREMEVALQEGQFCLYYQPKVNMASGTIVGVEALIRWQHPQRGLLVPDAFLPYVEGTALEINLGDWVIEQALQYSTQAAKEQSVSRVSINISSKHLQSPAFVDQLLRFLECYPEMDPGSLQLEILESSALGDLQVISDVIKKCQKACGVQIALDDFGTGYSSLAHMRNLSADIIKIDRSFVNGLLDDYDDYAIVEGVIALATSFNCQVLAEGVETVEQGLMLLLMGCEQAQGYAIARPMPASELTHWVRHYQANPDWRQLQVTGFGEQENQLQQYRLLLQHWLDSFVANIQTLSETDRRWPVLSNSDSPQAAWIRRTRRKQQFSILWLDQLEVMQLQLLDRALKLYGQWQQGESGVACEGLAGLRDMATVVFRHLESAAGHPVDAAEV